MVDITKLHIHQRVYIGKKIGMVQGILRKDGEPDKILVSFPNQPDEKTGKHHGIWNLEAYPPEADRGR